MNDATTQPSRPVVMCFSGHDATGGAGISADIESITSQGCHASTVITTLTVQDSVDIYGLIPLDPDIVVQTSRAVLEDMPVAAFKLGLMGSVEIVEAVHSVLYDYPQTPVIFDPVLASGSGTELADDEIIDAIRSLLLPMTRVLTPNMPEAAQLAPEADTPSAMANALLDMGCDHVLLTGTHSDSKEVVNRLFHNHREIDSYSWQRLPESYHGSGCTLAASLASLMALGLDPLYASREAQQYTWGSLKKATRQGMGQYFPNRHFWVADENE